MRTAAGLCLPQTCISGVALACAGLLLGAVPAEPPAPLTKAYFQGRVVEFYLAPPAEGARPYHLGPWTFGARVADPKPRDRRLNLYMVAPGKLHHAEGYGQFDHNDVLNALPAGDNPVEWDVYFAIVLDPHLRQPLRAERSLLLQAQARFRPGDLYSIDDVPGAPFLRAFLGVESTRDLRPWRDDDGTLPRLIIVPAGFAIRGAAVDPEAPKP